MDPELNTPNEDEEGAPGSLLTDDGDNEPGNEGGDVEPDKTPDGQDDNADGKPKEEDDADEGAPESYADFTVPEGMELDKAALEAFAPLAKEMNLSQEKAQKFVDMYAEGVQKTAEHQQEVWANTLKGWREEAMADEEFGGRHFQESIGSARKALDTFGSPKLREALDATGMGNHPELIRMLVKVGKAVGDDKFIFGKGGNEPAKKDTASLFYPTMTKS